MRQPPIQEPTRKKVEVNAPQGHRITLAVILCACSFLSSCTAPTPKKPLVEAPPPSATTQAQAPAQADQSQQIKELTAPDLNKVQEAVRRVFKDTALIDTALKPSFVSGDFNGDQSPDIAVALKPAPGKLSEINEEFPAWILKDPFAPNEPGMPRASVTENEVLLAVIHGYGPRGWNDPQATQTYLLKNAAGSGMMAHTGKEFAAANHGKNLPGISGDLIGEVLKGTSGYLYYGSATYSWYNPKTFKGEVRSGMVHSGAKSTVKSH